MVTDASQYTIIQRVIQDSTSSPTIFTAMYKFRYQISPPTEQDFSISSMLTMPESDFSFDALLSAEADADEYADMMDFPKSPNIFDLDFALGPDRWSPLCSPDQSVFSSPTQYPQSIPNIMLDEDEQLLLSPTSSFNGTDMSNYVSDHIRYYH
jgi:transcriptional enhancer factor